MSITPLDKSDTLQAEKIVALKDLFPQAFSDGKLNLDALKEELGDLVDELPAGEEHYGLNWPGKRDAKKLATKPPTGTLKPVPGEGVNEDTTKNLIIEGDNLEVLRIMQKAYAGRIKMIYIDPPYNTGNDFVYKDDFKEPVESYLRKSGQADEEGLLVANPKASGRFHSNWLNMMYPRLRLARNLLKDDGVIFVSIDDNEVKNLRLVLDEIFGEENFLSVFVWVNDGNIDNQSKIKNNHEYIAAYAKNEVSFVAPPVIDPNIPENSKLFKEFIENTIVKNGPKNPPSDILLPTNFPASFEMGVIEPNQNDDFYPKLSDRVSVKNYKTDNEVTLRSGWSSSELLQAFISNNFMAVKDLKGQETTFTITESGAVYVKKKRSENQSHVLTVLRKMGTVQGMSSELEEIGISFDYPKPKELMSYLCKLATNKGDLVLDFFAGSGSTAHGVLDLINKGFEERNFVLIQLPEPTKETSVANRDGFAVISEITKQRVRRIANILANQIENVGFKSLRLSQSNFRKWSDFEGSDPQALGQLFEALETPFVDGWTPEGVLTEVMLTEGFPLDSEVTRAEGFAGKVQQVKHPELDLTLLLCLDEALEKGIVQALAGLENTVFVCRESALSDELKLGLKDVITVKTL